LFVNINAKKDKLYFLKLDFDQLINDKSNFCFIIKDFISNYNNIIEEYNSSYNKKSRKK